MSEKLFNQDGKKIEGFTATCEKCGSNNVKVNYEFNYYGGYTGWDSSLDIECEDCDNKAELSI